MQQGMTDAFDSGEASYTSNGWRIPPMDIGDYGTEYHCARSSPVKDWARTCQRMRCTHRPALTPTANL